MKILIVDDEPLARTRLRRQLANEGLADVEEASHAVEALELAGRISPDLIFLDIQMPGRSGLDAANSLIAVCPYAHIVMVTGFPQHALEAFDRHIIDYLVKPVSDERLQRSLDKVRRLSASPKKAEEPEGRKPANDSRFLPIRTAQSIKLVPIDKIVYACSSQKHVLVKTRTEQIRTSHTLAELEGLLPERYFMRIHASCIVNLAMVEEILILGNHLYAVKVIGTEELPLARNKYTALQQRLRISSEN